MKWIYLAGPMFMAASAQGQSLGSGDFFASCKISSLALDGRINLDRTDLQVSMTIDFPSGRNHCFIFWADENRPMLVTSPQTTSPALKCMSPYNSALPSSSQWQQSVSRITDHSVYLVARRRLAHLFRDFSALVDLPMPLTEVGQSQIRLNFAGVMLQQEEPSITGLESFPKVRRSHRDHSLTIEGESGQVETYRKGLEIRFPVTENHRGIAFQSDETTRSLIFPALPKYQRPTNKLSVLAWGGSDFQPSNAKWRHFKTYLRERDPKTISLIDLGESDSPPRTVIGESELFKRLSESSGKGTMKSDEFVGKLIRELPKNPSMKFDLMIAADDLTDHSAGLLLGALKAYRNGQIFVILANGQWSEDTRLQWLQELSASLVEVTKPASIRPFRFYPWILNSQPDLRIDSQWLFPNDGFLMSGESIETLVGKLKFTQRNYSERFSMVRLATPWKLPTALPTEDIQKPTNQPHCMEPMPGGGSSDDPLHTFLVGALGQLAEANPTDPQLSEWVYRIAEWTDNDALKDFHRRLRPPQSHNFEPLTKDSALEGVIYPAGGMTAEICSDGTAESQSACNAGTFRSYETFGSFAIQSDTTRPILHLRRSPASAKDWAIIRVQVISRSLAMDKNRDLGIIVMPPLQEQIRLRWTAGGEINGPVPAGESILKSASQLYSQKHYQQMLSLLSLPFDASDAAALAERLHLLGLAHLRLGNFTAAQTLLKSAAEAAPGRADIWYNLACAFALGGRVDQAIDVFKNLVEKSGPMGTKVAELVDHAHQDPDLRSATNHPRWQSLIGEQPAIR